MCFKKVIGSFLSTIDIYSVSPSILLTFKSKYVYSTNITKFVTLIVIFMSFLCFIYFSNTMINHSNPNIVSTEIFSINPSLFEINKDSFPINFALQNNSDNYRPFIDETIYKPEAWIETRINESISLNPVILSPCELSNMPSNPELKQYLIRNHYEKCYCIKNTSIVINGTWDSVIFKDLKISFRICNNETDNNICKSPEIIKKWVEGASIVLHYPTIVLNPHNYENPIEFHEVDDFLPVSLSSTLTWHLYFGSVSIETDEGLFTENNRNDQGLNFYHEKISRFENIEKGQFLKVFFKLDRFSKHMYRTYLKIQDVLSNTGGLIKFFTVLGALFLNPFIRESFLQRISNEVFDYAEFIKDSNSNNNKVKKKNVNKSNIINMTFIDFLKKKIRRNPRRNSKISILQKSVMIMKKNLDISNLLNKFNEIEKMKFVLDDKQYKLLESIQKPKIYSTLKPMDASQYKTSKEFNFYKNFFVKSDNKLDEIKIQVEIPKNESKNKIKSMENAVASEEIKINISHLK